MVSSQMKNKIVFIVAIGFLLGVAQCRPVEDSVLESLVSKPEVAVLVVEDKVSLPSEEKLSAAVQAPVPVAVKDEIVAEASKDPESTILKAVPVVADKKADSSEENKSKDDSSSVESGESKESKESKESSEEIKTSPVPVLAPAASAPEPVAAPAAAPALVPSTDSAVAAPAASEPVPAAVVPAAIAPAAESTNAAEIVVPAPVMEIMKAIEPEVAVVENTVEPLVAAIEAAVEQAVASESSPVIKPAAAEPVVAVLDVAVEPSATEQEVKTAAKPEPAPVVEESIPAASSPVADAINTKAIDAEELVKPVVNESPAPAASETSPKVIIVTPSSAEVTSSANVSVDSKIDSVKEVPVAPVEEITKPIESEAPTTVAKAEEPVITKTTEKSSEPIKSKN